MLAKLARQPLLHFLLLGAAIGAVLVWIGDREAEQADRTIRIRAAEISRLEAGWQARWNRPPTPAELDGLIRAQIREAALYREAVAMGLDEDDQVVRRVLVQKLESMVKDLVELSLAPGEQDLTTYFAENAERYRPPPRITFTQVFVDPDRREERTLDDAAEILTRLRALDPPTEGSDAFGDSFMLQGYFPEKDERRIASLFGGGFARSVFELSPEAWHGPVLSGYGTHLVYVDKIAEFPTPALDDVREQVTQDWITANREKITTQYFDDLLARYEVVVERDASRPAAAVAANAPASATAP